MGSLRIATAVLVFAGFGCGEAPTPGQCDKLADHLIELYVAQSASAEAVPAKPGMKERLSESVKADVLKSCNEQLSIAQAKCGLAAKTVAALAECDQ